jgi:protein tyrosine phosphatase (PTP) superfamily phosphohydrolase (DUF442 family)
MGKSAELIIESRGAHFAAERVKRPFKSGMLLRAFGALFFVCAAYGCVFSDGSSEAGPRPEKWAKPVECAGVPNLHKINDSLYRSAQPTAEGMTNLVALGIKTVVNLRDNHSDEDEIGALPLKMRRIEIFTANMKEEYVDRFLSIVADTNATPVLVHCQHGADRTGTMCAMYRIMCEGWNVEDAIDEMQNGGYGYHSIWSNLPRFIRRSAKARRGSN